MQDLILSILGGLGGFALGVYISVNGRVQGAITATKLNMMEDSHFTDLLKVCQELKNIPQSSDKSSS
jgi:hypothetical protein